MTPTRCAIYARVSTADQHTENQTEELQRYAAARGWTVTREYIDRAVSGTRETRPALDALLIDARRRRFDTLLVWRLDRLGRSVRHLVMLLDELVAVGVNFASLHEGIDTHSPAGRLQLHLLAAIAEFERARIVERVHAGLARARQQGKKIGRPRLTAAPIAVKGLTVRQAAAKWGVSKSTAARWIAAGREPMGQPPLQAPQNEAGFTALDAGHE